MINNYISTNWKNSFVSVFNNSLTISQNAQEHSLGSILVMANINRNLTRNEVVTGSTLVALIIIARCTSETTIRERWKNKDYYSQVLEDMCHAQEHIVKSQLERESDGKGDAQGEDKG